MKKAAVARKQQTTTAALDNYILRKADKRNEEAIDKVVHAKRRPDC